MRWAGAGAWGSGSGSGSGITSWFFSGRDNRAQNVVLKYRDAKDEEAPEFTEGFDEIIFAADADACLKVLGKQATWMEKHVLGNVKYFWDISVTHYDKEYMDKVSDLTRVLIAH